MDSDRTRRVQVEQPLDTEEKKICIPSRVYWSDLMWDFTYVLWISWYYSQITEMHLLIVLIVVEEHRTERWLNFDDRRYIELYAKEQSRSRSNWRSRGLPLDLHSIELSIHRWFSIGVGDSKAEERNKSTDRPSVKHTKFGSRRFRAVCSSATFCNWEFPSLDDDDEYDVFVAFGSVEDDCDLFSLSIVSSTWDSLVTVVSFSWAEATAAGTGRVVFWT